MDNILAIGAGVALRVILNFATDSDHKLIGILIGLWEGVVLSHFLSKRTRSSRSKDPYLALATRLAIDLYLTHSLSRFALTCAWTLLGLLGADVAPGVWRDTGLRNVYKALRRELRSIRKVMPRLKIKNDLRMPKISIKNSVSGLFPRPTSSSVVSSTRAAPPASPVPVLKQRSRRILPPGTYPGHPALSETNSELSLVREVVPGPSPALIPTAADPAYRPPPFDLQSQRASPLSEDRVITPDDIWVQVDVPPVTFEVGTQTADVDITSPSPRTRSDPLPHIPDFEIDQPILAHQVPLPESRPASVVGSVLSLFGARSILNRARGDKSRSDVGIDSNQHQESLTDRQRSAFSSGAGQGYMGHYRAGSVAGPSMLRHADDDDESVAGGSVIGRGARTEPMFGGRSGSLLGAGGVGGLAVGLGGEPGLEAESIGRDNQAEPFVGGFAIGYPSQPLGVSIIPSQNPPVDPSPTIELTVDAPVTMTVNSDPQSHMDGRADINTAADEPPVPNSDNFAHTSQKQEKAGTKKKKAKNTTPAPPETSFQGQQHTSSDAHQPGPDQDPAISTGDGATPLPDTSVRPRLSMEAKIDTMEDGDARAAHGPDFPDGEPDTPPPPFKEVATPVESTILTQEQADRESLRGEFLMRELKHLEMLVAKTESGLGRGSPSALSVEKLNGTRERLVKVRMRVERRVYEDAPIEFPTPPQFTLSGIDGPSAVGLLHSAIVDMLLETPHAEPLALVGYLNKQKKSTPRAVETKTAVVDWVKENKFKVRTEQTTPFILNITF